MYPMVMFESPNPDKKREPNLVYFKQSNSLFTGKL